MPEACCVFLAGSFLATVLFGGIACGQDAATTPATQQPPRRGGSPGPPSTAPLGNRTRRVNFPKFHSRGTGSPMHPKTIAVSWISCRPSPALLGGFIASCCAYCSSTRTGRRRASSRFLTTGMRNQPYTSRFTYRRAAFFNTLKTAPPTSFMPLPPTFTSQ